MDIRCRPVLVPPCKPNTRPDRAGTDLLTVRHPRFDFGDDSVRLSQSCVEVAHPVLVVDDLSLEPPHLRSVAETLRNPKALLVQLEASCVIGVREIDDDGEVVVGAPQSSRGVSSREFDRALDVRDAVEVAHVAARRADGCEHVNAKLVERETIDEVEGLGRGTD